MKIHLLFVSLLLCTSSPIFSKTKKLEERIEINKETVIKYKSSFDAFLKSKEGELNTLLNWTGDGWFGSLCTFAIETFAPAFGLGDVDVKKAKVFLGRTFNDKNKLSQVIATFENSEDNIVYLQQIFKEVDDKTLHRKSRPGLIKVMHNVRHPKIPEPNSMALKRSDGSYEIPDEDFIPFAVCNLFACHILES